MRPFLGHGGLGGSSNYAAGVDAAAASRGAREAKTDVQSLERQLDRAMLACEAMWSLMRDKLGVTDEELVVRINDIDLADGQLDGKARKTPVRCPKCDRIIARRFPKCMYCGQQVMQDPFG